MTASQITRKLMKEQKFTLQRMADSLRLKRTTNVSSRLDSENPTFNCIIEMLEVLGYEVVIQPRKPGMRPVGQIVVERSNKTT